MRKVKKAFIVKKHGSELTEAKVYTSLVQCCVGLGYDKGDNRDYRRIYRKFLSAKKNSNENLINLIYDKTSSGNIAVIIKVEVNSKI